MDFGKGIGTLTAGKSASAFASNQFDRHKANIMTGVLILLAGIAQTDNNFHISERFKRIRLQDYAEESSPSVSSASSVASSPSPSSPSSVSSTTTTLAISTSATVSSGEFRISIFS